MRYFNPVISTAKVRGLIKKNGISYVDATRRNYPAICSGITVWQLCDNVYFKVYGSEDLVEQFAQILKKENLSITDMEPNGTYQIVGA